ncbi:MAG: hypothetical protein MJ211_12440 [Bacteroidales bacterium]|nr:hypothetical protein [Bacteroidales bacterium]
MFTYVFKDLTFTSVGGIIYRCFIGALILTFSVFYFYKNYKSFNLKTILPVSIYLVAGMIATFVTPSIIHANVSTKLYFESIFTLGMNAISLFVFIDHISNKNEEYSYANIICYVVVWFAFFLTISTYVFQFKEIGKSFSEADGWNYSVTSIFYIKTPYGYLLLLGSIFATILMFNENKFYFIFAPVYFAINAFISRNKTSLLFIIILMLASIILFVIKNWNRKRKEFTIVFSIIGGLVLILSLLTFVEVLRFGIFNNFYYFIKTSIFENARTVLLDRFDKWNAVFNNMKPFGYAFGYGEKIAPLAFNKYGTTLGDNIYVFTIGTGGIIKLALLLFLIIFIYKTYISSDFNCYKKSLTIILISCIVLAGLFEDDYIYGFNFTSLFAMPIIFCSNKIILNN